MCFIVLLSFFFFNANHQVSSSGPYEPTGVVVPGTPIVYIIESSNTIKVKLDTVLGDSIELSVIESFRGDLQPNTSITVPKRLLSGSLYPHTIVTLENEFDTLGSIPIPRRRIVDRVPIENFIDTFVIVGVQRAGYGSGYTVGDVYALAGKKAYVNRPYEREYGGAYKRLEHLDNPEIIQQMIKAIVHHIDSSDLVIESIETDYKQYISQFLEKFSLNTPVNRNLHHNGLQDLLLFDLNKKFGHLSLKDKIGMSVYSEQVINRMFPDGKRYYTRGIMDMVIHSPEELTYVLRLLPTLAPDTRTFNSVKSLAINALLANQESGVKKKVVRKFLRSMAELWTDNDVYYRERLEALIDK